MKLCFKLEIVLAAVLVAGAICAPAFAQRFRNIGQGPAQPRRAERQLRRQERQNAMRPGGNIGNPGAPNPNNPMPKVFERLQDMPPDRQEKFLQNNQRFQNLPRKQQALIRQRLQAWNRLSPGQQQQFRERQQIWEQLTPEQQREVRQTLLPRWQQLPPPRRQAILQRLHTLRDLNESERQTKLNDPAFTEGLTSEDRETLTQLAHLHVGMDPDSPVPQN